MDHSYEGCEADIVIWTPKIRHDGWLCGHDYGNEDCSVKTAVDEYLGSTGSKLELDRNYTWFTKV